MAKGTSLQPSEQPTETIFLETMGPVTESQPIVDAQGDPTSTWLIAVLRVVSTITLISISLALVGVFCIGLVLLFRYLRRLFGSLVGAILADEDADAADYTDEIDNLRSKRPADQPGMPKIHLPGIFAICPPGNRSAAGHFAENICTFLLTSRKYCAKMLK